MLLYHLLRYPVVTTEDLEHAGKSMPHIIIPNIIYLLKRGLAVQGK